MKCRFGAELMPLPRRGRNRSCNRSLSTASRCNDASIPLSLIVKVRMRHWMTETWFRAKTPRLWRGVVASAISEVPSRKFLWCCSEKWREMRQEPLKPQLSQHRVVAERCTLRTPKFLELSLKASHSQAPPLKQLPGPLVFSEGSPSYDRLSNRFMTARQYYDVPNFRGYVWRRRPATWLKRLAPLVILLFSITSSFKANWSRGTGFVKGAICRANVLHSWVWWCVSLRIHGTVLGKNNYV